MPAYVMTKGSRTFFRRRVPDTLVSRFGKRHLVKILPPVGRGETLALARSMASFTDELFAHVMSNPEITNDQINELLRSYYTDLLDEFENRNTPYNEEGLKYAKDRLKATQLALRGDEWRVAEPHAQTVLKEAGLSIDADSEKYKDFCKGILRAFQQASRIYLARYEGDYGTVETDALFMKASPKSEPKKSKRKIYKLSEVYAKFKQEKIDSRAWRTSMERLSVDAYNLLTEHLGDPNADQVTRQDISEFVTKVRKLPSLRNKTPKFTKPMAELIAMAEADKSIQRLSETTISKHMRAISQMFGWAKEQGHIDENIAKGVYKPPQRKRKKNEERDAWSSDQLKLWFSSPIYQGSTGKQRLRPGNSIVKDHLYWGPLLALYHGFRLGEIGQLEVSDIRMEDGISYIDINGGLDRTEIAEARGKSVKNVNARRKVPIHQVLIDLDFLNFVDKQRASGEAFLWKGLKPGKTPKEKGAYLGKRFNAHREKLGIQGVDFHSLRHNADTALSNADVHVDTINRIIGHEIQGERERYNKGKSIRGRKEAIDKIEYPGIDADFIRHGRKKGIFEA